MRLREDLEKPVRFKHIGAVLLFAVVWRIGHVNFGAPGSVLGILLGFGAAVALLLYVREGEAWPAIGRGLAFGLVIVPIATALFSAMSHPIATMELAIGLVQWARALTDGG
jgi:hypothetical protein